MGAFGVLLEQFRELKGIEQLAFIVGLLSLPVASWIHALFRLKSSRQYAANLEETIRALQLQRDDAQKMAAAERHRAALWMPDAWMDIAKRERQQGNEELAIATLRSGFERARPGMAHTSLALAGYHLSLIVSDEPLANLAEGERHAQLAVLLDPDDPDAAFLLEDARAIRAEGEGAVVAVATSFLPSNQDEAAPTIQAILAEAGRQVEKGVYRVSLRLVRRAHLIAVRAGLTRSGLGLEVEFDFAASLELCGKYAEALDVVTAQLPLTRRILGEEHQLTLALHVLECSILEGLGLYREGLERARAVIPVIERTLGADHRAVLNARTKEVDILVSLGQARLAAAKATSLLEAHRRVFREQDRSTLLVRYLEAQALDQFGEHSEALKRVESLIRDQREILGPEHPNELTAGLLRAHIHANLGDYRIAQAQMDELLPVYSRVLGAQHPFVIIGRSYESRVLSELGEHSEAVARITALKTDFERMFGAEHPRSLILRRDAAQYRFDSGDVDGTLAEVEDLLPQQERHFDASSESVLHTRLLRASALASERRGRQAAQEINRVSTILDANHAATHFLAGRARALAARLAKG